MTENTLRHLAQLQRAEIESLERSVYVYRTLLAKYEARLAEARCRLERMETANGVNEVNGEIA